MANGTLITESLRVDAPLEGFSLVVQRIYREVAERSESQRAAGLPEVWTVVEFEVADAEASELAQALSVALGEKGWYVNFQTSSESFVDFQDRIFRYHRGDPGGRARAQAYGRTQGIPDPQLEWTV